ERDRDPVTDRDHPRVFPRPLEYIGRSGGQRLEKRTRMLVRAMLAPQCADDAELRERRLPAKHLPDPVVFLVRQSVLGHERRSDDRIARSRGWLHLRDAPRPGRRSSNPRNMFWPPAFST